MSYKKFHQYRTDQETRDKYAETKILSKDLIYPYFIVEGRNIKREIKTLEGVFHFSIDEMVKDIKELNDLGIRKVLLFGIPDEEKRTSDAIEATKNNNLVAEAVKVIKEVYPELVVITDVCICGYTDHSHCGIITDQTIDNESTLPVLAKMALSHAMAGVDFVAPSAMMDGQVYAIKEAFNHNQINTTKILGYSAKFASSLYGPFRDTVGSAPSFGDRKSYQMDYRVTDQAMEEIESDIQEGADWVMVKPAYTYLDIISRARYKNPDIPLVAYHVSGEYMMIKLAAKQGLFNEHMAMTEALYAIKRAGADYIITYYAKKLARSLEKC